MGGGYVCCVSTCCVRVLCEGYVVGGVWSTAPYCASDVKEGTWRQQPPKKQSARSIGDLLITPAQPDSASSGDLENTTTGFPNGSAYRFRSQNALR